MNLGLLGAIGGFGQGLLDTGKMMADDRKAENKRLDEAALMKMRDELENNKSVRKAQLAKDQATQVTNRATELATADRNANLDQAEQTYRDGGYLAGQDGPAISQALSDARNQTVTPGNGDRVRARVEMGLTDPLDVEKLDAQVAGNAESRAQRQEGMDETRRYHDAMIAKSGSGKSDKTELTPAQKIRNAQIDYARKKIDGLPPDELKRRTQASTATGRSNPDYDPQIANLWKKAYQRKYGDDQWFDALTEDAPGKDGQATGGNDIAAEFKADPAMKGYSLGKETPKGFEVFDANGKLAGHYTR